MLKTLYVAATIIAGFSAARAQTSSPDCSSFIKSADWRQVEAHAPIDWPPYIKTTKGTMILSRNGMMVNGKNFYEVTEKACRKH